VFLYQGNVKIRVDGVVPGKGDEVTGRSADKEMLGKTIERVIFVEKG
jgi:hypothetical protein